MIHHRNTEIHENMNTTATKPLSKKAQKAADQQEAIARLRSYIKPGDTVYTLLHHVSSSGMSRRISLFIIQDNQPFEISPWAARAMDYRRNDRDGGLVVGGCGMDMGFHLVYHLGRVLFPGGFGMPVAHDPECSASGYRPETAEYAAKLKARNATFKHDRNGDASGWDNDGGYALNHRWM